MLSWGPPPVTNFPAPSWGFPRCSEIVLFPVLPRPRRKRRPKHPQRVIHQEEEEVGVLGRGLGRLGKVGKAEKLGISMGNWGIWWDGYDGNIEHKNHGILWNMHAIMNVSLFFFWFFRWFINHSDHRWVAAVAYHPVFPWQSVAPGHVGRFLRLRRPPWYATARRMAWFIPLLGKCWEKMVNSEGFCWGFHGIWVNYNELTTSEPWKS